MTNLIIIQARMDSSRLPKKVLMTLEGISILEHVVNSLKFSKLCNKIIVATTINQTDDSIETLCNDLNVDCFRGSSDDVLNRYYECAKLYRGDIIVRITCDNPLIDPTLVDEAIKICKEKNCDYVSNMIHQTYPIGYLVEVIKFNVLKQNNDEIHDVLSREHVTHHIRQNPEMYNIVEFSATDKLQRPEWRLTVDYENDYLLMKKIFKNLHRENSYIPYVDVVTFLDNNLELLKINKIENK
jgi:spore coat polysaccharide biosynthesis protein SpsF